LAKPVAPELIKVTASLQGEGMRLVYATADFPHSVYVNGVPMFHYTKPVLKAFINEIKVSNKSQRDVRQNDGMRI
jgi:hypothetical protein